MRIVIQSVILLDYSLVMYLPAKCNYGLTLGDVNKQTPNLDIIFDKFLASGMDDPFFTF